MSPELAALLADLGTPPSTVDELIVRLDAGRVKQAELTTIPNNDGSAWLTGNSG